jgi:hypothetical protein
MHPRILRKANARLQSRHLDTAPSEGWGECPHEPLGSPKFQDSSFKTGSRLKAPASNLTLKTSNSDTARRSLAPPL